MSASSCFSSQIELLASLLLASLVQMSLAHGCLCNLQRAATAAACMHLAALWLLQTCYGILLFKCPGGRGSDAASKVLKQALSEAHMWCA